MTTLDLVWSTTGHRLRWLFWTIPLALLCVHVQVIVLTCVENKLKFDVVFKFWGQHWNVQMSLVNMNWKVDSSCCINWTVFMASTCSYTNILYFGIKCYQVSYRQFLECTAYEIYVSLHSIIASSELSYTSKIHYRLLRKFNFGNAVLSSSDRQALGVHAYCITMKW